MNAIEELCTPDIEFDWSRRLLDPTVTRGYEGIRQFFEEVDSIFEDVVFEQDEVLDFGDEVLMIDYGSLSRPDQRSGCDGPGCDPLDDSRRQAGPFPFLPDEAGRAGGPGVRWRSGLSGTLYLGEPPCSVRRRLAGAPIDALDDRLAAPARKRRDPAESRLLASGSRRA